MADKRADKRIPLGIGMDISISDLYKEGVGTIMDLESSIEITDISSKGIGFVSKCVLPIGYYFIANIEISQDYPQIITDVRIIRSKAIDYENYHYGAQFVAISPSVKKMLDEYSATHTDQQ